LKYNGADHVSNNIFRASQTPGHAYSPWNELEEAYSRMDLTKQSDKLIAISGIAKHMQDVLNDLYVAGLWESRLAFCILCGNRRDIPMNTEPVDYIVPTWYWASINEKVIMYPISSSDDEQILFDIKAVEAFPVTDQTGSRFL